MNEWLSFRRLSLFQVLHTIRCLDLQVRRLLYCVTCLQTEWQKRSRQERSTGRHQELKEILSKSPLLQLRAYQPHLLNWWLTVTMWWEFISEASTKRLTRQLRSFIQSQPLRLSRPNVP